MGQQFETQKILVDLEIADRILALAEMAQEITGNIPLNASGRRAKLCNQAALLSAAKKEYKERGFRQICGFGEFVGEPAWDILLDLYIQQHSGNRVSVTSACIASRAPATTSLRYIKALSEKLWLKRTPDHTDARREWLTLTRIGIQKIDEYLELKCGTNDDSRCNDNNKIERPVLRVGAG